MKKLPFRPKFNRFIPVLLVFLLAGLFASCNDGPTAVPTSPENFTGNGTVDPRVRTDFLLAALEPNDDTQGRVEVWGRNLSIEGDSAVAFDLSIANKTDRTIRPPLHFVITQIVPRAIKVMNADGRDSVGRPYFDFSDDLGDDGVLSPGEETARVKVRFHWDRPTSFSIGFFLRINAPAPGGVIAGIVFNDLNQDGKFDEGTEHGIPGILIHLMSGSSEVNREVLRRTLTNARGLYAFENLRAGVHTVTAVVPPDWKPTRPNPLLVALIQLPDGTVQSFKEAHFGFVTGIVPPPQPERVFGPVLVGPRSQFGTELDSTFVIAPDKRLYRYFVNVHPPMTAGPLPIRIDTARVWINEELVFRFDCPADSLRPLCVPAVRLPIRPDLIHAGENTIGILVKGNEFSSLFISVERE